MQMKIAVTGATGFIGRYIVNRLTRQGHACRCWFRPASDRTGFEHPEQIQWIQGGLSDAAGADELVSGCDALIHGAFWRPGATFQGGEGDLVEFARVNILGSLALFAASREANLSRVVYISSCSVHDRILDDRPLDERHPLIALSHYGAHKAAIEKFVHSYGHGEGMPICALRPTGVYGQTHPMENSKWYAIVEQILRGDTVYCERGGKEVHAADVARAAELLLNVEGTSGEAYNCYDMYISQWDVAQLTKEISGSPSQIGGRQTFPKHEIVNAKIRSLGMEFGGRELFEDTISQMIAHARNQLS
jgi:nucleoside-diphosphate-sugar epimerase